VFGGKVFLEVWVKIKRAGRTARRRSSAWELSELFSEFRFFLAYPSRHPSRTRRAVLKRTVLKEGY